MSLGFSISDTPAYFEAACAVVTPVAQKHMYKKTALIADRNLNRSCLVEKNLTIIGPFCPSDNFRQTDAPDDY